MLLEVKDLSLSIGHKTILSKINFSLERGKTLGILGDSGSGKSLTALSIMRLLPHNTHFSADSAISFQERNLLALPEITMQKIRGRKISMVFQEPMTSLNPVLSVGEQIAETIRCHFHFDRHEVYARVLQLLANVGFVAPENIYYNYPHQLSGGMRQRIIIAIAIAAQPEILIADEPTSALDLLTQRQILDLLKSLHDKMHLSILFITHDINVVKRIADDVIVLQRGKVIDITDIQHYHAPPAIDLHKVIDNEDKQTAPLLDVKDLQIYFPIKRGLFKRTVGYVKAVNKVSFSVYPGRTLALVGNSGCGKTTLARGLIRLIDPTAGSVIYNNLDLVKLSSSEFRPLRKDLQIIFQDPYSSLNPRMQVSDIVAEGLCALNLLRSQADREQRVVDLLQQVGLPEDSIERYPHEFSGGQRQRIVIARALAVWPKLVICDEPTSALDRHSQLQIMQLLADLQIQFKLSYLFITHDIPLAAAFADEIAIMHDGEIVEQGGAYQILHDPQHPYTRELLESY